MKIAKSLKEAVEMGPDETAGLIRNALTMLTWQIQDGEDPLVASKAFQDHLGMDEMPAIKKAA